MKKRLFVLGGVIVVAAALASGCVAPGDEVPIGTTDGTLQGAPQGKPGQKAAQLNLSHVECTEDGDVWAHFVLLHAGAETPGDLSGTYNGGAFGPIAQAKHTGNVWHYDAFFASGEVDILSATVTTADGTQVTLHNPSEYAGEYLCGEPDDACPPVESSALLCLDAPLGNPEAECDYFGLLAQGKDDELGGTTFEATQDAYVAIVKSGIGDCEPGQVAYSIYVDVSAGDPLSTPTGGQEISHVTYCACPAEEGM